MGEEKVKNPLKQEYFKTKSSKEKKKFFNISVYLFLSTLIFGIIFYLMQNGRIEQMTDDTALFLLATIVQGMAALWGLLFIANFFFLERTMKLIGRVRLGIGFIVILSFFNIWIILAILFGLLGFLDFKNNVLIALSLFFCLMAVIGVIIITLMVLILLYAIPIYEKKVK